MSHYIAANDLIVELIRMQEVLAEILQSSIRATELYVLTEFSDTGSCKSFAGSLAGICVLSASVILYHAKKAAQCAVPRWKFLIVYSMSNTNATFVIN